MRPRRRPCNRAVKTSVIYPVSPCQPVCISDQALPQLLASLQADDLVILASPMAGLRGLLSLSKDCKAAVAWLCKGFEAGTGLMAGDF